MAQPDCLDTIITFKNYDGRKPIIDIDKLRHFIKYSNLNKKEKTEETSFLKIISCLIFYEIDNDTRLTLVYEILESCLKKNADTNTYNKYNYSPLSLIIEGFNCVSLVKLLFEYGTNNPEIINRKNLNGFTCLYDAVELENKEIIELLILNGANPNILNVQDDEKRGRFIISISHDEYKNGNTPLLVAISKNNIEIVEYLLSNNADPNIGFYQDCYTSLFKAIDNNNIQIVKLLLEYGADPNIFINESTSYRKKYLLAYAIDNNNIDLVNLLIEYGSKVNFDNDLRNIGILNAIDKKNSDIIDILIENNLDLNKNLFEILFGLIFTKNKESLKKIIAMGVDINFVNHEGKNLLFSLFDNTFNFEQFKIPIEFGIDLNYMIDGQTIIFSVLHDIKLLRFLLDNGADPNLGTDDKNKTTLENAILYYSKESVKLLLDYGFDINRDFDGKSLIEFVEDTNDQNKINTIKNHPRLNKPTKGPKSF